MLRRRKSKKYNKTLRKQKRNTKEFHKFESIMKKWMTENQPRFNAKPISKAHRYGQHYTFEGVIENVTLNFAYHSAEGMLFYSYYGDEVVDEENYFDQTVISYIGGESFNPQRGFYDSDRVNKIYSYYPTREALYINELELMLEYCNEKILPNNSLYLFDNNGITSGFLGATDEEDTSDRDVQHYIARYDFIDDCSEEVCKKLYEEDKAYRVIKYELFNLEAEPLIRYIRHRRKATDA